ncbi:MAG: helix-turn-helix domain-containing protein [Desulfovibrio sp.]|nr:helix-turn-helix domain-containing protein [Desulfovibrio sp.]
MLDLSRVGQGCPDTLVAYGNRNVLMEIKREKKKGQPEGTLTPDQKVFFQTWRGPACVVHTPEEALAALGFTVHLGVRDRPDESAGAEAIAAAFGVSRRMVYAWVRAGAPIVRIGKRYQCSYSELWKWLQNRNAGA